VKNFSSVKNKLNAVLSKLVQHQLRTIKTTYCWKKIFVRFLKVQWSRLRDRQTNL